MKFFSKKLTFFLFVILSVFLSSCAITESLWVSRPQGMRVEGFFIDKEKSRVVLVSRVDLNKPSEHWSISDPKGNLVKVFENSVKTGDMYILLNNVKARGSKIYGSIFISFKLQNLSKDDLEFLEFKNINPRKSENAFTTSFLLTNSDSNYTITQTIRYYSDSEPFKNICSATNKDKNCSPVIVLKEPWQGVVDNKYTATEKSWRVVATPFAVVADIILIPYYAYQLTKESQTPHFCEGEFCGYDNIKQNNPNEKPQ